MLRITVFEDCLRVLGNILIFKGILTKYIFKSTEAATRGFYTFYCHILKSIDVPKM